jgi:CspA family cold shock protein
MVTGVVKFYNPNKSFGFITGDDGKDYFVHKSGLKEGVEITEGDKVSFEVVKGDKGPKAEQVEKIDESEESDEDTESEEEMNDSEEDEDEESDAEEDETEETDEDEE